MVGHDDGYNENGAPANVDHRVLLLPSTESEGIITQTKDTSLTVSLDELNSENNGTGGIACSQRHSRMNTLSPEIIAEIFMHCIPNSRFGNIPDLSKAPLLLVQICRYWRDVAMSTPHLWCSLHVDVDTSHFDSSRASLMRTWLERSKMTSYPLCLCLVGIDQNIPECISVMVAHMSRCRELSLVLDCDMLSELQDVTVPLPFLEDLYLESSFEEESFTVAVKTFAGASRLRSVKLRYPGALLDVTVLPWRQLQELLLRIEGKTVIQCWEVLEQCRDLVDLDIAIYNGEFEDYQAFSVERRTTEYPKLQTLKINAQVSTLRLNCLLSYWVLPKLRCLVVKGAFSSAGVTYLLSTSTHEIKLLDAFTQGTFFRGPDDVMLLLRYLPSLVVLKLDVQHEAQRYSTSLIESLIYRPSLDGGGQSCLLPNLRILNLGQLDEEDLEFAKDMLESRYALEDFASKGVPAHPVVRLDEAEIRSPALYGSGWATRWFINDKGDVESHRRFSASSTRRSLLGEFTRYSEMQSWGRWCTEMTAKSDRIPPPSEPRLCSADLNALVYE